MSNDVERGGKMKKKASMLVTIISMLCIFVVAVNAVIGGWVSYNINRYVNLTMTNDILPKLEELGEYEDVDFKFYRDNMLIFQSDTYILKVSYDDENYEKEKELIDNNYIYQTETLIDVVDENTYKKEPSFMLDTFNMKMLSQAEYRLDYPKEIVFIGKSDEKKTISYVYYLNWDLDYIDIPFEEFLKRDCGW